MASSIIGMPLLWEKPRVPGGRQLIREATQRWRGLSPDQRIVSQGARLLRELIFQLRRAGDRDAVRRVLNHLDSPQLRARLSDHQWAFDCESALHRLNGEGTWANGVLEKGHAARLELIGPPGSGKTAIATRLASMSNSLNIQFVRKKTLRSFLEESHFESSARKYADFLQIVEKVRSPNFEQYVDHIYRSLALLGVCDSQPHLTLIDDEGPMQRGFNLAHAQPRPCEMFLEYFNTLPAPTAAVIVRPNLEQVLLRNQERHSRALGRDMSEQRFFTTWIADLAETILVARTVPVISISNEGSVDGACDEILAGIKGLRIFTGATVS